MAQLFVSGMAHFFVVVSGSKIHERVAHFFIDIYSFLRHHTVCAGKQDFIENASTAGSKQDVENQIQQELAILFRANQKDARWD